MTGVKPCKNCGMLGFVIVAESMQGFYVTCKCCKKIQTFILHDQVQLMNGITADRSMLIKE